MSQLNARVLCAQKNYSSFVCLFFSSVKEVEHLDWSARMRVIMGTAYCLQYMHHDLNPPVSHSNLNSVSILLTDDFAAKV
jgi:hypothetical protein